MEEMTDETLETLLAQHQVPPASSNLSARIIAAATPREVRVTLWQALAELLKPAPVAAFACSLLLGIIAGQMLTSSAAPVAPTYAIPKISQNAGAFLYYNGEVL